MEIVKPKISAGYALLRAGSLPDAMVCFIDTIEHAPTLAGVARANIQQTQRYFKNIKESEKTTYTVYSGENTSPSTNDIILNGGAISLNGQSQQLHEGTTGASLAHFAALHPASQLMDAVAGPASLLLGLMYRLLWKTRVTVHVGKHAPVALDDYLQSEVNAPTLAQLVLALQPANVLLIQLLGRPQAHAASVGTAIWPRKYARLGALHDDLVASTDEMFLHSLLNLAVGRVIQPHEFIHFEERLQAQLSTRQQIANIVCNGAESKRYVADHGWKFRQTKQVYSHPEAGDVVPAEIHLPLHANPKVSVLIPVYEKVEYTLECLKSIADHPPKVPFEVIVMDDRSPDGSASILQQVKNLRVVLNPQNLGFLRSCNNGAKHAKGEYLFFLNNDTQVKTGWLDELVDTFTNFPNCGLAGSKLIYPDGLLQEAGGIVWQDGSAWNYGNRQDPNLPQFNYAREVDYVSGAAIMVPAELFTSLGGFDERYAPAYYEDTDLALQIRALGKSVIYQPLSEVVHFEGISSGTDTTSGIKAYQVINREKFLQRWKDKLQSHRPNGVEPHLERDRGAKGRVLFIDACTPTPDQDSGSIDIYNLMKVFMEMGWAVTFIPEDNYAYMDKYTPALQKLGVQALYLPHLTSVDDHVSPYGSSYDLVMSFRPMVTQKHIRNLRLKCPKAKIVFNTVDLHFLRLEREAKLKNDLDIAQEGLKLKAIELDLMKQADLTTVVSSTELEMLQKMGVKRVVHLPFSREIQPTKVDFYKRSGVLFVGGFQHQPNIDSVLFFIKEVMPYLREMDPTLKINIVGSNTPPEIQLLSSNDIIIHGYLEDLNPLINSVRINVAPLRYGAGTKGKVAMAMACGLPTIGTSIAFEGMGVVHNSHVIFADTALDLAKSITHLNKNFDLWKSISNNGLDYCRSNFGIDVIKNIVMSKVLESKSLSA
jgi:GT2 family glycosyltransferase